MTDRAALAYLAASGATMISIVEHDGVAEVHAGNKSRPTRTSEFSEVGPHAHVFWLPAEHAIAVSRQARHEAGAAPDVETMTAALREATAERGVALMPDDVAVERAGAAAARVDAFVNAMRQSGGLQAFNRHFKPLGRRRHVARVVCCIASRSAGSAPRSRQGSRAGQRL